MVHKCHEKQTGINFCVLAQHDGFKVHAGGDVGLGVRTAARPLAEAPESDQSIVRL